MVCAPVRRDCLTCTMISSVDLAYYGVSRANDLEYVDCDTRGGGLTSKVSFKDEHHYAESPGEHRYEN